MPGFIGFIHLLYFFNPRYSIPEGCKYCIFYLQFLSFVYFSIILCFGHVRQSVFTGRQHSQLCKPCTGQSGHRRNVRLSVSLSVCHTLALSENEINDVSQDHEIFTDGQPKDSSFRDKKFIQKFERVHPERGRQMRVGQVYCRPTAEATVLTKPQIQEQDKALHQLSCAQSSRLTVNHRDM